MTAGLKYNVIVIGHGDAGASAAIEAADNGAKVLLLDRSYGGGASALSGGVGGCFISCVRVRSRTEV